MNIISLRREIRKCNELMEIANLRDAEKESILKYWISLQNDMLSKKMGGDGFFAYGLTHHPPNAEKALRFS